MPLFYVAVREHTYTGRFYSEAVQAESPEEALQVAAGHAAVPRPPPGPHAAASVRSRGDGRAPTGRLDTDVVQALRREEAPQVAAALRPRPGPTPQGFSVVVREQVAAGQAAAPEPRPGPTPQTETAGRPGCADVWVYALLHCELEAGHDPPHMAVAHRYRRPVRWVRDDRGIAQAVPGPATGAPVPSSITQPSPVPEPERPEAPFTGADS